MRITEALKIRQKADKTTTSFQVALACGFTPLHLATFLSAHLQQRLNNRQVEATPGLYGDLAGTLESLRQTSADAIIIALEWSDIDPRLGFRSEGRWSPNAAADIPAALQRLRDLIEALPATIPVAISMPTLPLPPIFHTPGWHCSGAEAKLDALVSHFAADLPTRIHLVSARRLAEESAPAARFDLKSDLATGLPYTLPHADALAAAFSRLLIPTPPKKGLITDLDDTLWSGLVGEVGPEGVAWDLARHKAIHGLYQRLLAALAEEGVLIGVASKNDGAVVAKAFEREDIGLPSTSVFPTEVHWNAKSGSIARILQEWNIGADSVVFVDDSPMELAEVAAAHPGIECIQFGGDGYAMLRQIRDLFGRAHLTEEDVYRASSLRQRATLPLTSSPEDFLAGLNSVITVDFAEDAADSRVLDLINKTNQFNLNGIRYTQAEWAKRLLSNNCVLAAFSYEDKYGPLGKISALQGWLKGRYLHVEVWVLSCRAFARRIEHQCLQSLFDRYDIEAIHFAFAPTPKNAPIATFLSGACGPELTITRDQFKSFCPRLYHTVKEARRVEVSG